MSRSRLIILLLALGTLFVFLPAGKFDFINYDDPDYVTENPHVREGLDLINAGWAFTSFHAANWHPLTWLSLMADAALFGPNAGAMHFINVLFHAANAALVFALFWRLTGKLWPAAWIAALFAWHPLHVESVAWISERKDVLSTFFGLITLLAYARFAWGKRWQNFVLALGCFALSLMAKPMLVTLPFVMLLLDFWPLQRFDQSKHTMWRCVAEKIPFFLLVIPVCIVTSFAQHDAMASLERIPIALRLENSLVSYASYLFKIFWPADLAFFYPLKAPSMPAMVGAILLLITVTFFVWHHRHSQPYLVIGWLWFLGTLIPVIGLVQVGEQAMADRYTYFPAIGIFIIVAYGGAALAGRFQSLKPVAVTVGALTLVACIAATEMQLRHWRTDETLFRHAVEVTSRNEVAHLNLGVVYEKEGRADAAMQEYRQAIAINPRRAHTHNNIADLLDEAGRPDEALAEYQTALQLDPEAVSARLNLGTLLVKLGRFDEALAQFDLAAKLKPTDARPPYQTGKALLKQGHDADALNQFHRALQLDPGNPNILAFTARVLAASDNPAIRNGPTALELAARANELSGGTQPLVLDALGMAYAANGDFTNATASAQKALDILAATQTQDDGALAGRLALYQAHQPWRESFRATNAP